jgi:DNA-binding response OmpR family regulator
MVEEPVGSERGTGSTRTLLVVDDEERIARGVASLLRRRGYAVIVSTSGYEALRVLGDRRVEGLIVDFQIPDLRGDVLIAAALAVQPHLAGRTIVLTGDITDTVAEVLGGMPCVVLLKPFEVVELERVLRSLFSNAAAGGQ